MNKHTEGTWMIHGKRQSILVVVTGIRPDIADQVALALPRRTEEEQEANARLICAAPALLAACKALLRCVKQYPCFRFEISAAKRAIAQAEGGKVEA